MTTHIQKAVATVPTPLNLGEVPVTYDKPGKKPNPDQIPLAYDPQRGELWVYIADMWVSMTKKSEEVSLKNISNLENAVRIPVAYEAGKEIVEGYLTLKDFHDLLKKVSE